MFEIISQLIQQIMVLVGYVGGGNAFPKALSSEEEEKYLRLYKDGDMNAKNMLIEHNLRLVAHIAKKYSNESNSDDLISIGIIGLIKGINTFNPDKNKRLAAYVSRCIENEVLMVLRNAKKSSSDISLDESIGTDKEGNNLTLADIIPAENEDIVEEIEKKMKISKLYKVIDNVLSETERNIIIMRYGIGNRNRLTQREVATKLGISRSYVSRIEKRALSKMEEAFGSGYKK